MTWGGGGWFGQLTRVVEGARVAGPAALVEPAQRPLVDAQPVRAEPHADEADRLLRGDALRDAFTCNNRYIQIQYTASIFALYVIPKYIKMRSAIT